MHVPAQEVLPSFTGTEHRGTFVQVAIRPASRAGRGGDRVHGPTGGVDDVDGCAGERLGDEGAVGAGAVARLTAPPAGELDEIELTW